MAKVGKKVEGFAGGKYPFVEYSIQGIPKKLLRIVVQKNEELGTYVAKSVWHIYKVTPKTVISVGWSKVKENAMRKATDYIRKNIKSP
jgi:hypothetical protein